MSIIKFPLIDPKHQGSRRKEREWQLKQHLMYMYLLHEAKKNVLLSEDIIKKAHKLFMARIEEGKDRQ